jgi:hypothetical protein
MKPRALNFGIKQLACQHKFLLKKGLDTINAQQQTFSKQIQGFLYRNSLVLLCFWPVLVTPADILEATLGHRLQR